MLRRLAIQKLSLVDHVEFSFDRGFTVLTGETGAGKSMILHAVDLVLGARASADDVQQGETQAVVEAVFDVQDPRLAGWLKEKGYEVEDELLIRRVISREGKSQAYVNGAMVPLALLKELGASLAEVHGQHEQQNLLKSATHLEALDAFGKFEGLRATVEECYRTWHERVLKRESLVMDEQERVRQLDLLAFQKQELETARLVSGEEDALQQERERLRHADTLAQQVAQAYEGLTEEGQAVGHVERAAKLMAEAGKHDPRLLELSERLKQSTVELRDIVDAMRDSQDRLESNPERLEEVEERLALIERLKRKYGPTVENVLQFQERVTASWRQLAEYEKAQDDIEQAVRDAEAAFSREARELSKRRKTAAVKLVHTVGEELAMLGMPHAKLEMAWTVLEQPASCGLEQVEWLISTNPGEPPRPLAKVASGGELSRVMLAVKVVLAKQDRIPTLIFDEVDAGVGGRTAEVIGKKLKFISRERQVVCVTHMAQVASFADTHYQVVKQVEDHRTTTRTTRLASKGVVVEELAKMISGEPLTPTAVKHAEELFERAQQEGKKGEKGEKEKTGENGETGKEGKKVKLSKT